MPALVRRFTPSKERAPSGRWIASIISPSVIISQRQIMLPYSGCSLMSLFRSSKDSVSGRRIPFRVPTKSGFFSNGRSPFTISVTISAIAGAEERPGDSIPAALINPFASFTSPITKSLLSSWARSPANEVMTWRIGTFFTLRAAVAASESSPEAVVLTASLSSTSTAVGPTNRFPCTVGVTRTPFPILEGSWKIVWETWVPASLSNRQYSPFRAVI